LVIVIMHWGLRNNWGKRPDQLRGKRTDSEKVDFKR